MASNITDRGPVYAGGMYFFNLLLNASLESARTKSHITRVTGRMPIIRPVGASASRFYQPKSQCILAVTVHNYKYMTGYDKD